MSADLFIMSNGASGGSGGSGTVTSVGFEGDGVLLSATESGPVTTSGILSATLLTQTKNTIFAGPSTGSNAAPTFRVLGTADLPTGIPIANLASSTIGLTDSTGLFTVSGSPASLGSSLTLSAFASQAQGAFLGGPASGSGAATFRTIAISDLPTNILISGAPSTTAGEIGVASSGASSLTVGDGTNRHSLLMALFKGVGFAATGNVTNYATVLSTPTYSSGSLTLVANQQAVGSVVQIRAGGTITVSTATQTIGFEILLNGTVVWSGTIASVATSANAWEIDGYIYCSATGASGTAAMQTWMVCRISDTGSTGYVISGALQSTTSGPATTGTQLVDVQMKFGTSESANTCQCQYCEVSLR